MRNVFSWSRILAFMAILCQPIFCFADPTVTDVVAKQRRPWGLVDITCKVSGIDETSKACVFMASAIIPDSGRTNRLSRFWIMKDGEKSMDWSVSANGSYRLLWDAKTDFGEVCYTNMVLSVTGRAAMVLLWEGGPYWATMNIGAERPEDYGYYFWWGDTVGYKRENDKWVASDGSNSNFSFAGSNVPTYGKSNSALQSEGWITADGVLTSEHDAAHAHWGGDWRMPTASELVKLNSKCDWTWVTKNGVNGYVVRGRGEYASNSIFLPCAGYGNSTSLSYSGSYGCYWSSKPSTYILAYSYFFSYCLIFNSGCHDIDHHVESYREHGCAVRPVQRFTK